MKKHGMNLNFCRHYNNLVHTTEFCKECPYNISDENALDENTLNKGSLNKNSDEPNKKEITMLHY